MTLEPRTCPGCGETFTPADPRQRYCNKDGKRTCYWRMRIKSLKTLKHRICANCGKPFTTYNDKKIHCTPKCTNAKWCREHRMYKTMPTSVSENNRNAIKDMLERAKKPLDNSRGN